MILLTKLPPLIPARSPRKSSGSAHMMLNIINWRRVSLSFQRLWIKTATLFFRFASDISICNSPSHFRARSIGYPVFWYIRNIWKSRLICLQKNALFHAKPWSLKKKIVEHASVAWLGIFLQCSLPN